MRREPGQIRAGVAYVRGRPDLLLILAIVFFAGTFGLNFQMTSALMATEVFDKGPTEYGLLGTFMAVGSLAGATFWYWLGRRMTPEHIYTALTTGVMQAQAEGLSDGQRRAIAEYLGDRKLGAGPIGDVAAMPNRCTANPPIPITALDGLTAAAWNGWGSM